MSRAITMVGLEVSGMVGYQGGRSLPAFYPAALRSAVF